MAGYISNLACDWLSIVWVYSEQETENGPDWWLCRETGVKAWGWSIGLDLGKYLEWHIHSGVINRRRWSVVHNKVWHSTHSHFHHHCWYENLLTLKPWNVWEKETVLTNWFLILLGMTSMTLNCCCNTPANGVKCKISVAGKIGSSSPPRVETFSVSKTLTLSQEHPFVCPKWMLLPAHS